MKDFSQYRTDGERLSHLHELTPMQFDIAAQWERQAQSDNARTIFHDKALYLYHRDEGRGI